MKRLTGTANTAVGNFVTNLLVHMNFVETNWSKLVCMVMLGDDMAILFNEKPNITNLIRNIYENFNIKCKPDINEQYGTFC